MHQPEDKLMIRHQALLNKGHVRQLQEVTILIHILHCDIPILLKYLLEFILFGTYNLRYSAHFILILPDATEMH